MTAAVYLTIPQTRMLLAAIALIAAIVLALDLTRLGARPHASNGSTAYAGIPRNTPGSTAHLRVAYRASLHGAGATAS